jgi:hypothetical protein
MLKSTHREAMNTERKCGRDFWFKKHTEKEKELNELNKKLTDLFEFKEKKAVAALEQKLTKEKLKLESDLQTKMSDFKEKELSKMYDKLSGSLTKLHEEGNANSKFIQEMNLTMAKALTPALTNRTPQLEEK